MKANLYVHSIISSFIILPSLLLLLLLVVVVHAHPGAVAQGRATCGVEYSTPEQAYIIPDMKEAWYLRRVSTCESPVFWATFSISEANQELYLATIAPEIHRFRDGLQFHAILYGPGVDVNEENGFYAIPETLPFSIEIAKDLGGAAYLKPPSRLSTCDFVDTNPVMKDFSDVIGGRCMEQFTYEDNYSNRLMQGATVFNWWLYSFEHRAAEPGTYYLQTWLTSPTNANQTVVGKYEMTLAPWVWYRYASEEVLQLAQSQGTACSCAYNELDYRERLLTRLGGVGSGLFETQLPAGTCSSSSSNATTTTTTTATTTATSSLCYTIAKEAYRSRDSTMEWSGIWTKLQANVVYEWIFFAYYQSYEYEYPDPGMLVYLEGSNDKESVAKRADHAIKAAVARMERDDMTDITTRVHGDTLSLGDQVQYILFSNTNLTTNTTVLIQPNADISIAVFTQHVPSEFMAHVLKNQETGEYIFPTNMTLYSDEIEGDYSDEESENTNGSGNDKSAASTVMVVGQRAFSVASMLMALATVVLF